MTQLQRWLTTCSDGSRAITRYDVALDRYRADITKAPKSDKAPRGWSMPRKAQQ